MKRTSLLLFTAFILHFSVASFSQSLNSEDRNLKHLMFSSGLIYAKSKVIDPFGLLGTKYIGSYSIKVLFQKQLRNRLLWEIGLTLNDYWSGYKINDNNPIFLGSATGAFKSLESSYGLMYKIKTKSKRDILNVHMAFFIGYAFSQKGQVGQVGYFNTIGGQNIIKNLEGKVVQPSLIILGNSIGISRDFRITDRLGIGVSFNYNLGYNKLRQINIEYTTTDSSDIYSAQSILSATSWQSLLFLKFTLN